MAVCITVLSMPGCGLTMLISWLVAHGRLRAVYSLGIVNSLCFVAINGLLALGGQPGVLFLVVPSAWGIAMSVLGLRRLSTKERPCSKR